ncbi:UBX domain-containing protein 11 isoform X3 [Dromiciops gliroides]|uniref:UBX domain-containing protein 11 isoform X3 n=1 Tax=Dromiciops gliroides TaxID=33562 RepID=UPI001CC3E9F1|nr:UBX domain-containing protein 11 isoform X3 [Dromiciops gliroides]
MSSPLASLSKIRRVPLQPDVQNTGRRSLPSRMKAFGEDEDDLSNDGLSSEERAPGPGCTREKPFHLGRSGSLPHDMGLVSSLVKRLTELEQKVKTQAEEINFKDQWIKSLKLKIKNLQPDEEDQRSLTRTEELEAKCQHLQNQVHEMERFLNDYGLEWVGEPSETQMDMETDLEAEKWTMKKLWKPGESTVPAPTVNFDELLENLRDLSLLAGEGQSLVHTSSSMAMLKTPEPVPLTLYQNGIIMFNGPFRPFSDVSTQQCIQDILDGFFPSELKKIYPSGVPFQVTDLRNVVYQEKQLPNKVFSGPGYVVGRMNSKETKKLNDQSVIEVREPIRETLEGCSGSQEILVETERLRQSSREIPTTTLRIKSENGEQTFVLPMSPLDTIGDVRRYLAQARDMDPAEFEIFTAFPPTVYRDDSKTLQACGLVPNAILLLRPPKTPHSAPSL